MPAKNRIKQYLEDGYYHIYNRGVEKRVIFLDLQDYSVFNLYLKEYLMPKNEKELFGRLSDPLLSPSEKEKIPRLLRLNNFDEEITLLSYCLMPNHFHFEIKQKSPGSIDKFMNSLGTRYTMYFNKKYKRVGSLYQGVYRGVLVNSDEQLLQLSAYIHRQALALKNTFPDGQPSSYYVYTGVKKTEFIKPTEILSYFSKTNPSFSYEAFVKQENDLSSLSHLLLETTSGLAS